MRPVKQFKTDVIFNYISLALFSVSGILINIIIIQRYSASTLGQFNLIYAYYVLISQISVLGVHYSILRTLSLDENKSIDATRRIITAGLALVGVVSFVLSIIMCCVVLLMHYFEVSLFVIEGFKSLVLALPFFAFNKVLLAAFNGKRRMRLFSFAQGCRYVLMLGYVGCFAYFKLDEKYLSYVFLMSEALLFIILMSFAFALILRFKLLFCKKWFLYHLKFGGNAFFSGVFLEVNSRIDVIILAYFVSSSEVGIYSFAAMIAEGISMMLYLLKNHVNPIIANLLEKKNTQALSEFMIKIRKYTYLMMFILMVLVLMVYFVTTYQFMLDTSLWSSWPVLLIILACMGLVSGYLPFSDFLIQANKPRLQSIQNVLVVAFNILLSILLIPKLGIIGAAIAVGVSSYIISILLIDWFARKQGLFFIKIKRANFQHAFE